jgi:hypothetical protein
MLDLCGLDRQHLLTVGAPGGGRHFMTYPRIDTNAPQPKGWGAGYIPIDYDGVPPVEYSDDNGRINRCLGGPDPWVRERIDTISCWAPTIVANFSADVDGDGYLDVVCDIGSGGNAFRVISGGPQAGKGCERVTSFDVPSPGSEYDAINALYRSVNGSWRMLHHTWDKSDEYLILYDVRFNRTSPRGDGLHASFEAIDTIYTLPGDIGRPSTIGSLVVVQDTILKRDYMVLFYKPGYTQWVTERFDLTDGQFNASGERVAGYLLVEHGFGHSLQTERPVVQLWGRDGEGIAYAYVDDLVHPFAFFNAAGTGIQPAAGFAVINDQTGDGLPDLVWSGGNPATLLLVTLDTTIVTVEEQQTPQPDFRAHISGMTLTVQTTKPCSITIDVATVDGRAVYMSPVLPVEAGEYRQDLAPALQPLTAGAYFVRVKCDAKMVTIPIQR